MNWSFGEEESTWPDPKEKGECMRLAWIGKWEERMCSRVCKGWDLSAFRTVVQRGWALWWERKDRCLWWPGLSSWARTVAKSHVTDVWSKETTFVGASVQSGNKAQQILKDQPAMGSEWPSSWGPNGHFHANTWALGSRMTPFGFGGGDCSFLCVKQ